MVDLSIRRVSARSCLCRASRCTQLRECSRVSGRILKRNNTLFKYKVYAILAEGSVSKNLWQVSFLLTLPPELCSGSAVGWFQLYNEFGLPPCLKHLLENTSWSWEERKAEERTNYNCFCCWTLSQIWLLRLHPLVAAISIGTSASNGEPLFRVSS